MSLEVANPPRLLTTGKIAAELGVPIHRVVYVLDTRPWIRPTAMAGTIRLYSREEALAQIRHELTAIGARRSGKGVACAALPP